MEKKETKGGVGKAKASRGKAEKKKLTVNEEQIDLLLDMIKTADVTSEENQAENTTLLELEGNRHMHSCVEFNSESIAVPASTAIVVVYTVVMQFLFFGNVVLLLLLHGEVCGQIYIDTQTHTHTHTHLLHILQMSVRR